MRAEQHAHVPLYLMAKAPRPGEVKTRMSPPLSAECAARLARMMILQTLARALQHWRGEVVLCVSPDSAHPLFAEIRARHDLRIAIQINADLGARMLAALRDGIARAGAAAVMGCDVPHCPREVFARAHTLIARGENTVGPAADGGFYLLGVQCADDKLFDGVDWNGGAQLMQLRARAKTLGMVFADLQQLRDIDHFADLKWLAARDENYATFTAAATDDDEDEYEN